MNIRMIEKEGEKVMMNKSMNNNNNNNNNNNKEWN